VKKQAKFRPGKDRVYYNRAVYGNEEINAVSRALGENWLGNGKYTVEFEKKVSQLFGKKYGLFVNSGTSANYIAMELANLPPKSEVITQAFTFPATLAPIVQKGHIPVFIDSKVGTYNIDIDKIEPAISSKTKAIFISHAIGNVNDMKKISKLCKKYKLIFIEDSCDTIACKFDGKPTGTYSDITTTSFYAAHHITAGGGGGMVMINDPALHLEAKMLNDWGRRLPGTEDENIKARFASTINNIAYDAKMTYVKPTFNFKAVEIQAAFGLAQLKKLKKFNNTRSKNFDKLYKFFVKYQNHFYLPVIHPNSETYLLSFPLTIRPESPVVRNDLMTYLENNKIQTRTPFAGNILYHPAYSNIKRRVYGSLENADLMMRNGLLIGCHHGLTNEMLNYIKKIFTQYLDRYDDTPHSKLA
jgi:CDP-4-dehydro-6-deoxyglucose reductase, E1